jgi:hypothetical protein
LSINKINIALYFELSVWLGGLLLLAFMNPATDTHYSLCPLHWLGFDFCPGCGIGHAISWFFHGQLALSIKAHPLGTIAVAVLLHRIYILVTKIFLTQNKISRYANR